MVAGGDKFLYNFFALMARVGGAGPQSILEDLNYLLWLMTPYYSHWHVLPNVVVASSMKHFHMLHINDRAMETVVSIDKITCNL